MQSVMKHNFSQIPKVEIPRSVFDRSHGHKTTFNSGYLVPIYVDEALPGDSFHLKQNLFARLATPKLPFMDNLFLETFYFAVPYRLVWNNWQKFNGEQENPDDSTDYLIPTVTSPQGTGFLEESLFDYFGVPTGIANVEVSALWTRAYNLIWNEWFRDQNLQDSVVVDKDDGPDDPTDYVLLRRGKRHDYFTSCLPFPQKGTAVEIPIGTQAPVYGNGRALGLYGKNDEGNLMKSGLGADNSSVFSAWQSSYNDPVGEAIGFPVGYLENTTVGVIPKEYDITGGESGIYADLSSATAATINQLREAFQLQRLYERDARGGTRYTEIIRSHFGVVSPDARLQRPEYLGGGSTRININPVQKTSSSDEESPQGHLAAYGLAYDSRGGFTKSFTEHTLIIGLVNVRADLTYQQGLPRMFSRRTRWDHYWPALAHLGEQEVLNKEIFCGGNETDDGVFGYQERWAEYRYKSSQITGKFRSTAQTPLDTWHLSQKFEDCPVLNSAFIQDTPPVERVVAITTEPQFLLDCYFELKCARPMPVYSVPGLIDHF